jgi:hypothetical protein
MPTMSVALERWTVMCSAENIWKLDLTVLENNPLPQIVKLYDPKLTPREHAYIQSWPSAQLDSVRGALIRAVKKNIPITFGWQENRAPAVLIGGSDNQADVTFLGILPEAQSN